MKSDKKPLVSIIIPLHVIIDRFFVDIEKYFSLHTINYEIIIVTDVPIVYNHDKVSVLLTGRVKTGPAEKRDLGLQKARGKFCAFIDDDAFPDPKWLDNALRNFNSKNIVAVGGPGITPSQEPFLSKLGGYVYESIATSGKAQHRFVSKDQRKQYVNDWPAYNLIVRTDILKKVGGYGCAFYGGEDTFLCLKLIKQGKIVYDPSAIVYHHRRPLFLPHLQQIYNIGVHRGYFFKKFPETSRKIFYVLPSVLTIGFWASVIFVFLFKKFFLEFIIIFSFFWILAFISVIRKTFFIGSVLTTAGIILTHMAYGFGFLHGLLTNRLTR